MFKKRMKRLKSCAVGICLLTNVISQPNKVDASYISKFYGLAWQRMNPQGKIETTEAVLLSAGVTFWALGLFSWLLQKSWQYGLGPVVKPAFDFANENVIKPYRGVDNRAVEKDPMKVRERIYDALKKGIQGQDEAIEKVVSVISGYVDAWDESDRLGIPFNHACCICLLGDSGVGKTETARILSKVLYGKDMEPWQYITTASIPTEPPTPQLTTNVDVKIGSDMFGGEDSNKDNAMKREYTPADRLFHSDSLLVRNLKFNNRRIIVIDEIDKIHQNSDPKDTILEKLRDARDTGVLRVTKADGSIENIDVSRVIFILNSNEFAYCMGVGNEKDRQKVDQTNRTVVERDPTLVRRFDVVEYKDMTVERYCEILDTLIKDLMKNYKEVRNIELDISSESMRKVCKYCKDNRKGVRGLLDSLSILRGVLVTFRDDNNLIKNDLVKLEVDFDAGKWSVVKMSKPDSKSEEPGSKSEEPGSKSEEPGSKSEEPDSESEE